MAAGTTEIGRMKVGDYLVMDQVGATAGGALYLGRRDVADGLPALLKLSPCDNAGAAADLRLRKEYALLQSLDAPEILKPIAFEVNGKHVAMVLEPFASESLEAVLTRRQRFDLPVALNIARQLASTLAALHAAHIVHHDIRPANFLLAHDGVHLKLADLSRATFREDAREVCLAVVDWTYVSPEQTGRMNRQVDYRTDFYSLGILLHRLLTGQLPFHANDPLEWAHCHLARLPVPPHQLVPGIPEIVSDLVLKLLAKVPEERYQSASGLRSDLEQCLDQWQATGKVAPFLLGTRDVSDRFEIPRKLYGRERESATLLDAFDAVASTATPILFTVAGYSGVGKSALVNELLQPIIERHGYFLVGKFDQYERNTPYATLAQAFDRLVRQLLGESEGSIGQWRQALCEALGTNGQLVVNLIPRLLHILGPQPPVPELPPWEAQTRFQLVFRRFLGVFARQDHPLVLFLDDLQWVDAATLALLEHLMTHPDVCHLLLVGAYRDNEVDAAHPLRQRLEAIRQAGAPVQEIVLAPLKPDDVEQLVAQTLHCPPAQAEPLAQLVLDKTGGNPFFTRQFLTALADEKLLAFDHSSGAWKWNLLRIRAKGYTDNVVDLMVSKLARLPLDTLDVLKRFACLGSAADAATLGLVLQQSVETVHHFLWEAARAGLVCRQDETYTFLHDRVQEATYLLIPETSRAGMHLTIGRVLVSDLPPDAVADRIFEVVNQLNRGSSLVESRQEREQIAELNLLAGKRAKVSTAYASALTYLVAGEAMLAEDCWERRYELAFGLQLNRAECEFLTGALREAEQRLSVLSTRAVATHERAAVACLRVELYMTLNEGERAIAVCLDCLRQVGIDWSLYPTQEDARREYEQIWSRIGGRTVEELIELPLMSDPALLGTMDVLTKLVTAAWLMESNLPFLAACRAVNLSLEHGNCDSSCYAYAWLGMSLAMGAEPRFGDHRTGVRLGELGGKLVEQRSLKRFQARIYLLLGAHVVIWGRHLHAGRDLLRRAFDAASQSGDLTYGSYCCNNLNSNLLAGGDRLIEVEHEAEHGLAFVQKMHFDCINYTIAAQLGFIRMLRGLTVEFGSLNSEQFDELQMEHLFSSNPDPGLAWANGCYWVRKLQARFLAGDHAGAIDSAKKAGQLVTILRGSLETTEYHFYAALSHAASCDSVASNELHVEALSAHHVQLQEWARNCPENFENRAALVAAEMARIGGRTLDALSLYERAIRSAHDNGFVQNEAIASERAARFYLSCGLTVPGNAYLEQARSCYAEWGAAGKVKHLEEQYPQLRRRVERAGAVPAEGEARLDLLSVAKASQAISGEILLNELIATLMRLVLENAGAQTCYLLLAQGEELTLVAEARVEQHAVQVRQHAEQPLSHVHLPLAVLQYVRRSREPVLLMNALAPHPFAADTYFAQRQPKSVLCLPILRQSALVGLLYLENSLATHAFTPERVQVLELLASQAAISLDNARLYADVRDSHARIRRLVESNIIGIFFWDLDGNITDANDELLLMTGYSREELKSGALRWTEITPLQYRETDARAIEELKLSGSAKPFEKEFIRKDGTRFAVLIGITLFEQSRETGVAFVLDLSERKRAEAEREARDAAEAANRAKSSFLAHMSHELRTPLNGILGYAQILQRDPVMGERQLAGVNVIRKSGEHLLTLIDDILDLAKIEAGKIELCPADLPLAFFVKTITDMVSVKAEQKGLELVCDLGADLPQEILADERRLRQVLLNLLSNAIKFTDHGRVVLRVRFAAPARLCCEVQDTGVGIAADQVEAIFEPFQQAGDTRRRLAGTGLGLAISRQYVRLMGGDIQVESQLGQGSTFRFEVAAPSVQRATEVTAYRIITGYAGPRKKVLVVDDIVENRAVAIDLLTPLGFEVAQAANGREGLETAQSFGPDLMLIDIVMPEMDGLAAVRCLRQQEAFREVPIVAVSAGVSASDSEQCLEAGMNAFLPKPLDGDKLLEQIAMLLRLEWTYGASRAETPVNAGPVVVPPPEEMDVLHRVARMGNMREIMAQAERLARLDERYRPFANQLSSLARNYQSMAVLRLVEEHRPSGGLL